MTGETIGQVEVGFGADEIQFSLNGTQLAVANSGEPDFSDPAMPIDPPSSISLIDLSGGLVNASVQGVDFTQFDGHESELRAEGIRLRPDATSSADLAPEGIAFAPHGELWAALQQNNALAAISIDKGGLEIERLIPLGAKDHSLPAILWCENFLQQCRLKGVSKGAVVSQITPSCTAIGTWATCNAKSQRLI